MTKLEQKEARLAAFEAAHDYELAAYYDYIRDTEADEEEFNEDAEEDWQHECEERHGFEQV